MGKAINLRETRKTLFGLLKPEAGFFWVAIAYGVAISLMTLAVPIAVQTLINSIANIGSSRAVIILASVLFLTLFVSGVFSALRMRIMEFYERKVYARLTAALSLRTIMAPHSFFEGRKNTNITQRYFDIMTLQKNIPSLMIDGFALVLQMLVGFTLVSFYHPALFAFNLVLILVMYAIWKIWGAGAKRTAIELSNSKYESAKWLNDIAAAHEFFKSADHAEHAGRKTDGFISNYLDKHENHFRYTFSQVVMFLLLYACASAALLGIGGVLVVQGQLSIGQLVAAELIMSAVFFGLSRFTQYLKLYYELYGAADKIGSALTIPEEEVNEDANRVPRSTQLAFSNVVISHGTDSCFIDTTLKATGKYFVTSNKSWVQKQLTSLMKRYEKPNKGEILLGDLSLHDYDTYELRQAITILDRSLIVECTIEEYLRLANPSTSIAQMRRALTKVELCATVDALPNGLSEPISVLGAPLQALEFLLLKLAAILIAEPKVLIINQHFDAIPQTLRVRLLDILDELSCTVLYFTNTPQSDRFTGTIHLHDDVTELVNSSTTKGANDE
jgi:putative ABC transport system ATP-binding protein